MSLECLYLPANKDTLRTFWTNASRNINSLGVSKSSEEAGEVTWQIRTSNGVSNGTNIGTKDENHRSRYGTIIENPKSNGASDRVEFIIPADQVQANIAVKGTVGGVAGTTTSGIAVSSYAGPAPGGVLDTAVTNPADHNLILVGGPAVNRLSAQFLNVPFPSYGAASGLAAGEAMLSWKDNAGKVALVVAGWEADDTTRAAMVLRNFEAYKTQLTGKTEVKVTGSSSSPIIVSSGST